jgi:hypothetical protein
VEKEKKKKSFFATIWESMTKTGGCCGGGGNCCGPSIEPDSNTAQEEPIENQPAEEKNE